MSKKKRSFERDRLQKSQKSRKKQQESQRAIGIRLWQNLIAVFGDQSEPMIRLASIGMSPEEMARRLEVSLEVAEQFVDRFNSLPIGVDEILLNAPCLVRKEFGGASMKASIRAAKRRRNY